MNRATRYVRAIASLLVFTGCHNARYSSAPEPDTLRFYAYSQISDAERTAITVSEIVQNIGSREVGVEIFRCARGADISVYRSDMSTKPAWTFEEWRAAERRRALSAFQQDACLGEVLHTTLRPGDSMISGHGKIPIRVILGDSLRAGKYRIVLRSGWANHKGVIPAGELDLPFSPRPNGTPPAK